MQADAQTVSGSKKSVWAGRAVSAIPVLFLLFVGSMKLLKLPSVLQGFAEYGYPAGTIPAIGILEIGSTIIYLIPRTAVLGAILMTGLLGGAIASNVPISNHLYFIPLILGVLV
jgi:DoxX-like protein